MSCYNEHTMKAYHGMFDTYIDYSDITLRAKDYTSNIELPTITALTKELERSYSSPSSAIFNRPYSRRQLFT